MSFFQKLFKPAPSNSGKFYNFDVKCKRCGEVIHGQVNVNNEPSLEVGEDGKAFYICRKVLIGDGKNLCFQQIEAVFKFNENRGLIERTITGGEFVEG